LKTTFDTLPPYTVYNHEINLDDSFKLQQGKLYKLSPPQQVKLDKFIREHLSTGHICPSKSPQASPFFFIAKGDEVNSTEKNTALRPIQDYRYLNSHTIKDRYSIPLISKILDDPKLHQAHVFTVLDIHWGFNNIHIKEGDEWKAAFITNQGLYEPTIMFFRLCNSPPSFQRMIDNIFQPATTTGLVKVYIDDVLIFTNAMEEHEPLLCLVLDLFHDNGLSCKPIKC
jgi:hypothetical protein